MKIKITEKQLKIIKENNLLGEESDNDVFKFWKRLLNNFEANIVYEDDFEYLNLRYSDAKILWILEDFMAEMLVIRWDTEAVVETEDDIDDAMDDDNPIGIQDIGYMLSYILEKLKKFIDNDKLNNLINIANYDWELALQLAKGQGIITESKNTLIESEENNELKFWKKILKSFNKNLVNRPDEDGNDYFYLTLSIPDAKRIWKMDILEMFVLYDDGTEAVIDDESEFKNVKNWGVDIGVNPDDIVIKALKKMNELVDNDILNNLTTIAKYDWELALQLLKGNNLI